MAVVLLVAGCTPGGDDPRQAAIEGCDGALQGAADTEAAELGPVLDGLSPVAVACVLEEAGTDHAALPVGVYPIVEGVLVRHPEVLVQSEHEHLLTRVGIERSPAYREIDDTAIDKAVLAVFRRGGGDELIALKAQLLPVVVNIAIDNEIRPSSIPDLAWLGSIDGRLTRILLDGGIDDTFSAEGRQRRIDEALSAGVGGRIHDSLRAVIEPTFSQSGDVTVTASTDVGNWPDSGWPEGLAIYPGLGEEEVELSAAAYPAAVARMLVARGRLMWPPESPLAGQEITADDESVALSAIEPLVTDAEGRPTTDGSGSFITLEDWWRGLHPFENMSDTTTLYYGTDLAES